MTARQRQRATALWTPEPPTAPAMPEAWMDYARCAETDPEAYFPEKGEPTSPAKSVCRRCEVRTECLEYALKHNIRFGVWGGTSEKERRKLKRQEAA